MKNELEITSTNIKLPEADTVSDNLKAFVSITFNDCFVVKGLKVIKGQWGHFISFPSYGEGSPYKIADTNSISFRKYIQNTILKAYSYELTLNANKAKHIHA